VSKSVFPALALVITLAGVAAFVPARADWRQMLQQFETAAQQAWQQPNQQANPVQSQQSAPQQTAPFKPVTQHSSETDHWGVVFGSFPLYQSSEARVMGYASRVRGGIIPLYCQSKDKAASMVDEITISGNNANDFKIVQDNVRGKILPFGADGSYAIQFTPSGEGLRTATLSLTYHALGPCPAEDIPTLDLQGTGLKNQAQTQKKKCYVAANSIKSIEDAKAIAQRYNHDNTDDNYYYCLGTDNSKDCQCAWLTKTLTGLSFASTWQRGEPIRGHLNIPIGTAIATFNFYGDSGTTGYGPADTSENRRIFKCSGCNGGAGGVSHTGIYLGQDQDKGILILDQYSGSDGPHIHYIPWDSWGKGGPLEAGNSYFTINGKTKHPSCY
jgi:hypothetical protein